MVSWRDKNGKSFLYDEKGNTRLVQFRNEQEMIDGQIMFSVQFHYPKLDLEHERPFGYSTFEKGPNIILEVNKKDLGSEGIMDGRFALLDGIENVYKKDLLNGQRGFSNLVKRFTEVHTMEERGQLASYLQDRVQSLADKLVDKRIEQEEQQGLNAFDKLSSKQKQLVVAIQNWAKENNVKENTGRVLTFNSKSPDAKEELDRIIAFAKSHGFVMKTEHSLKPSFKKTHELVRGR